MSMESLVLRQEITERVLSASLDIDGVNAVIDAEIEQIRSIRSDLQSRRDKAQNIINIASIVTGGAFGAVTSALQFKPGTVDLGNGIGVAGGAGSVALSIVGIRKQSGWRRLLGDSPRMLARFFGRQPDATEAIRSVYPEEVWSYLNSATPSQSNGETSLAIVPTRESAARRERTTKATFTRGRTLGRSLERRPLGHGGPCRSRRELSARLQRLLRVRNERSLRSIRQLATLADLRSAARQRTPPAARR